MFDSRALLQQFPQHFCLQTLVAIYLQVLFSFLVVYFKIVFLEFLNDSFISSLLCPAYFEHSSVMPNFISKNLLLSRFVCRINPTLDSSLSICWCVSEWCHCRQCGQPCRSLVSCQIWAMSSLTSLWTISTVSYTNVKRKTLCMMSLGLVLSYIVAYKVLNSHTYLNTICSFGKRQLFLL